MKFPTIPYSKIYQGQTTPEQDAQMKLMQQVPLSQADEEALHESVNFYEEAYPFLKSINLTTITEGDRDEIINFLNTVLNYHVIIQNNLRFINVFRVTFVQDSFLETGKVRDAKYISYPPADIIKQIGRYGRANSPDSTCLYCAFDPVIALLETKPQVGQRIIISHWQKRDDEPFVSFPILNNDTVENEGLKKATAAFKERMSYNHPLFARTLELLFEFLSSEFVKSTAIVSERAYEYLFSAYFSDLTLLNAVETTEHPTEPISDYDCIIYPSVASKHRTDNIAVKPKAVERLSPVQLEEIIITNTDYENAEFHDGGCFGESKLPIAGETLRSSNTIKDGRIIWNDD